LTVELELLKAFCLDALGNVFRRAFFSLWHD
jgi:hypothetical protein